MTKLNSKLKTVTQDDIQNSYNFNLYPNIELRDIIEALYNKYKLPSFQRIRLDSILSNLFHDTMVISLSYKFLYEIPRPTQLNPKLKTIVCTSPYPTYPGAHTLIHSSVIELLSRLYPQEKPQLDDVLADCSKARMLGGVHFEVDNTNAELLGRKIGAYIYNKLQTTKDETGNTIDSFENDLNKIYKTQEEVDRVENEYPLMVLNRIDQGIDNCNSLIDERSTKYNNMLKSNSEYSDQDL